MFCPKCGMECGDGVTECSECHVPLATKLTVERKQHSSDPDLNLVVVLDTSDPIQCAMAKGLLDDAGIPLFTSGELATLVQALDPLLRKRIILKVPRKRESEAKDLLEQLLRPGADDPEL